MSSKKEISTHRISQVIKKMHKKGRVTKKDIQDILLVSRADASRYLEELTRLGTIKKRQTKSGRAQYVLDLDD
jgi:predicted transcriptional regulator